MFRTVKCEMWRQDDWFADLPPDAKLVWIYTFTNDNASPAGIYRIALRTIANETGVDLDRVKKIIVSFQESGKLEYENGIIWPITMRKHQTGELKDNDNLLKKINKDVAELPPSGIVARYMAYYTTSEGVPNPLRTPFEPPSDTLLVNRIQDTGYKRQDTETGQREGIPAALPPPPADESMASGRFQSSKLKALNDQVSPALRTPLANVVLDLTGKRALADAGGTEGDKLLMEAHGAAVALYRMGYKSESDLLAIEPAWSDDWRGVSGGTAKQFCEFASECLAGKQGKASRGNGRPRKNSLDDAEYLRNRYGNQTTPGIESAFHAPPAS